MLNPASMDGRTGGHPRRQHAAAGPSPSQARLHGKLFTVCASLPVWMMCRPCPPPFWVRRLSASRLRMWAISPWSTDSYKPVAKATGSGQRSVTYAAPGNTLRAVARCGERSSQRRVHRAGEWCSSVLATRAHLACAACPATERRAAAIRRKHLGHRCQHGVQAHFLGLSRHITR